MGRRYPVQGTKSFLITAIILLALCIWCIMDGWFPSQATLDKHSLTEDANFYLFNKSLAILSAIGAIICGYIHLVVK